MIFCIDYENVRNNGVEDGCQYLGEEDKVVIFYSDAANNIHQGIMRKIAGTGCGLEAYKLARKGQNALDFYIASYIGQLAGAGEASDIAIISKDQGFMAVVDYYGKVVPVKRRIILGSSIGQAMAMSDENKTRKEFLDDYNKPVGIQSEIDNLRHIENVKKKLRNAFSGTCYEGEESINAMIDLFLNRNSDRDMYLSSLHVFGRSAGLEIYHKLKEVA